METLLCMHTSADEMNMNPRNANAWSSLALKESRSLLNGAVDQNFNSMIVSY